MSRYGVAMSKTWVPRIQVHFSDLTDFVPARIGTPLAASLLGMLVLLIGALNFWRQQAALVRGKVWARGWEIVVIMGMSLLVSLCAVGTFSL
jgi:uncharacterized membrane protein YidH (DUF202 family)